MATDTLPPETTATNPCEFDVLYAAWKHAKATWEAALYAPDNVGRDLPQEVDDRLCEASCAALNAFLLHPAEDSRELLVKLRVFRDEEIAQGWWKSAEIVNQLVSDAKTAAFGGDKA